MSITVLSRQPAIDVTRSPYNAKGDGTTDDTNAINAAVAAAVASSGRELYFSRYGTFVVDPSTTRGLDLASFLTYGGGGVIKTKANAGNYSSVFRPQTLSTRVQGVVFRDLIIDQHADAQTNATAPLGSGIDNCQFGIMLYNWADIHIDGVTFENCCGVNTVYLNGTGYTAQDAHLTNNVFNWTPLPNATNPSSATDRYYDNSAVYIVGERAHVSGNSFLADPLDAGRGACEFHGPVMKFAGNIVDGYQTMINLGTTVGRDSADWLVTENLCRNVNKAVTALCKTSTNNDRIIVNHNDFHIDSSQHELNGAHGINIAQDVTLGTGDVSGIKLADNLIMFEPDTRSTTWTGAALAVPQYFVGIAVTAGGTMTDGTITNNTIVNAPCVGIRIGDHSSPTTYKRLTVAGNKLTNIGMMDGWATNRYYAWLEGNLTAVTFENNDFYDDLAAPGGARFWLYAPSSLLDTVSDTWVTKNRLHGPTNGTWASSNIHWTKLSREFVKATIAPGTINAGVEYTTTVTLVGVGTTDVITAEPAAGLENGFAFFAYPSAADTITLSIRNYTAGNIAAASRVWRFRLHRTEQDA